MLDEYNMSRRRSCIRRWQAEAERMEEHSSYTHEGRMVLCHGQPPKDRQMLMSSYNQGQPEKQAKRQHNPEGHSPGRTLLAYAASLFPQSQNTVSIFGQFRYSVLLLNI